MPNRIRRLFSRGKLSPESREFIAGLADSRIWILAVGVRGVPSIPDPTDPAAVDIVADHQIDVAELGDDDSVFPFNYEHEGKQVLPFFSSREGAQRFASECGFPKDVTVFEPYSLRAGFVATAENEAFELVLDPGTEAQRKLSWDERMLLRLLSKPAED